MAVLLHVKVRHLDNKMHLSGLIIPVTDCLLSNFSASDK